MSGLMEQILEPRNRNSACKKVCANKGASGIDDVTTEQLSDYIKEHWKDIKLEILERRYTSQPVKRVEIPKPNGGTRKPGIPTAMERVIQQAMVQVLSPICGPYFSESSYGFRPNRSCEMAVVKLKEG